MSDGGMTSGSASSFAFQAGSEMRAHCSAQGAASISAQLGLNLKGWTVPRHAIRMPLPRNAIWATILAPAAFHFAVSAICSSQGSSLAIDCSMAKVTGRPVSWLSAPIQPNSSHSRLRSDAISNTPWPARATARPMPISSSLVAVVPGTSSPSIDLWRTVREVEKPSAPAFSPSSTIADIWAISCSVGASLRAPRSPIT